jgi:TRAP-type C4-dicarboxylate transport system permease small subunit
MLKRLLDNGSRLLEGAIAVMLAVMVVLVFGNVVLRYGFGSGITVSEELSRWLFVWLTFLGALVALRRGDTWAATSSWRVSGQVPSACAAS